MDSQPTTLSESPSHPTCRSILLQAHLARRSRAGCPTDIADDYAHGPYPKYAGHHRCHGIREHEFGAKLSWTVRLSSIQKAESRGGASSGTLARAAPHN